MSAVAVAPPVREPAPGVVPQLARAEARRLLRHPVMLVGFGLWIAVTVDSLRHDLRVVQAFETITASISFFPGVPAILAAHMVATRDRRAGTVELLTSAPVRLEARVRALLLSSFVPAALALLLNAALTTALVVRDEFAQVPTVWHVAQGPLTVLGACLLGTMIGVWAPSPVAPVVSMVALVAGHIVIAERGSAQLFGPAVFWADWGVYDGSIWVGLHPGSAPWHLGYVAGLCGLAAAGALLRVAAPRGPVLVLGLGALALTVVAGVAQLP
jgi:hypothetical protein